ncbi:MAG: hypothetical protein VB957_10795 [Pseudomonadales bacterium]
MNVLAVTKSRIRNYPSLITVLAMLLPNSEAMARETDPLFQSESLLDITLRGSLLKLSDLRDRDMDYGPAQLSYKNSEGKVQTFNVKLTPRGNKRLSKGSCKFPPIKIAFKKAETSNTIFSKIKKMKLVTQCHPESKKYEYYLLTEYLAYKALNILSEKSYGARLSRISYIDNTTEKTLHTSYGFFIEPSKRVAKRIESKKIDVEETSAKFLEGSHLNLVSLFQMMIGNTDWSATHGGANECCHNGKLFGKTDAEDNLYIPYDFDMTGLVNPEYAAVDKALKLTSIRERRYRGYCRNLEFLDDNISLLNLKQAEIYTLFENSPYLTKRRNRINHRYIEKFYGLINNPKRVKRKIYGRCHQSIIVDVAKEPGRISV